MSKFNAVAEAHSTKTKNLAGGKAFKVNKNVELFSSVVTTFLSDKFYESAPERMERIATLAAECDPEFVAKVAVWAREDGYLRSAPVFLTAILTSLHNGDDLVRRTVRRVCSRADEMTELLAAYRLIYGKKTPFSKQMMKGIADCFNKFDEYQFSKYNRAGEFRLKDALFLAHPVGKNKIQKKLFDKIAKDELETADTWETRLTATEGKEKDAAWADLIEEKKLGHMALLRNLRNILDNITDVDILGNAYAQLTSPTAVQKGKQFPFRYLAAYNEIENHDNPHTSMFLDGLEECISIAAANVPGFDVTDSVAIFNDVSGSMSGSISEKSTIDNREVGIILGTILRSHCKDVMMGVFADNAKIINTSAKGGIIQNCKKIDVHSYGVGGGTSTTAAIRCLRESKAHANKVVLITDMQLWSGNGLSGEWDKYKEENPEAKLYIIDVAGYGATPISILRKDVVYIAGWNEKVFKLLEILDNGEKLVNQIGQIEL